MAHTCKTCGAVADSPGHLCSPCDNTATCSFCGTPEIDIRHICRDKLTKMRFVCEECGRVGMEKTHLCKPQHIA